MHVIFFFLDLFIFFSSDHLKGKTGFNVLEPRGQEKLTPTKQPVMRSRSFVFLEGEELELVTQFKYLGVILDSNLTFIRHIKNQYNKIQFTKPQTN